MSSLKIKSTITPKKLLIVAKFSLSLIATSKIESEWFRFNKFDYVLL